MMIIIDHLITTPHFDSHLVNRDQKIIKALSSYNFNAIIFELALL